MGEINNDARANDVDLTSSERHRSPETYYRKKVWDIIPKLNKIISDQNHHNTENSIEPHISDDDYDKRCKHCMN